MIIASFIFIVNCNDKKSIQVNRKIEIKENVIDDSIKNEIINDSLVLVEVITKFNENKDYYIPLSYKFEYSDSIDRIIQNSFGEKIFQNDIETRTKIPNYIAEKYFLVNGLDKLILINKDQEIVDTIFRKNYEFYDAPIESFYVSTYESSKDLGDSLIALSSNVRDLKLKKTYQPTSILDYNKQILQKFKFDYDQIFSHTTIVKKSDTISILSFGNYAKYENYLYLFINGNLKDSIINDYMAVSSLTAVPLATENELTYIYSGFKPDTDWLWNGLLGIDLINWKFKLYENNRIKR